MGGSAVTKFNFHRDRTASLPYGTLADSSSTELLTGSASVGSLPTRNAMDNRGCGRHMELRSTRICPGALTGPFAGEREQKVEGASYGNDDVYVCQF